MTATGATRRHGAGSAWTPAVLSELYKCATVRSTWWFVGGAAAVMLLNALLVSDDGDPATAQAVPAAAQAAAYFVQYILGMLGGVLVTGEFVSRSITVTFTCTASRTRVMTAKAVVVGGTVFVVGTAVAALGALTAAVRLGEAGDMGPGEAAGVLAIGLHLSLMAVLGLGIGTLVRRSAGVLAILVLLLVVVPELMSLAARRFGPSWLEGAVEYTPAPAGWRLMAGEWEYALVTLVWAGIALAVGGRVLRVRDV